MTYIANAVRAKGDPKILSTGPSSLTWSDRMARNLGWLSLALGASEIAYGRQLNRTLGNPPNSSLPTVMGLREIGSGLLCLSVDKRVGLWSRVAGDGIDIAVLTNALNRRTANRQNVKAALATVLAVTVVDLMVAASLTPRRKLAPQRRYTDRSGFPNGRPQNRIQSNNSSDVETSDNLVETTSTTVKVSGYGATEKVAISERT